MFRTEKESKNFKMAPIMKDNFSTELNLVLVITYAIQVSMKANFQKAIFTEMVFLLMLIIGNTTANGKTG